MTLPARKLSVTIITRDEEAQIGDCLESVRWADEIIVVDTGSVDRTLEICAKYTTHVYSRPWEGYAAAKNAAIALATGHWILSLDADERVSEGLRRAPTQLSVGTLVALWGFVPRLSDPPVQTRPGRVQAAAGARIGGDRWTG